VAANHRFESRTDRRKHHANLEVRCSCGHRSIVDGENFSRWTFINRFDNRIFALKNRLRCSRCGARPEGIRAAAGKPTAPNVWPKDEGAWRRAVARLRG
jgi:DNA-directed RNA polymerase subunit RPC12/RpoP